MAVPCWHFGRIVNIAYHVITENDIITSLFINVLLLHSNLFRIFQKSALN